MSGAHIFLYDVTDRWNFQIRAQPWQGVVITLILSQIRCLWLTLLPQNFQNRRGSLDGNIKEVLKVKNKSRQFPASNIINNFTLGLFPSGFSHMHTYFNTDVIKA